MIPYFMLFIIIITLAVLSQLLYKKNKLLSYVISAVSIAALCVFAAIRAYTVGTDIYVYGYERFFKCSQYDSILQYISIYDSDWLYQVLNYTTYKLFNENFRAFLFIHQLIISTIVYIIAYKEHKKGKGFFSLYIITYLFIWYASSFNILRQSIAMFIVLYAFEYLENNKYIKYGISIVIASFFHSSSLLCFVFIPFDYISKKKEWKKITAFLLIVLLLSFISLRFVFSKIFINISFLSEYSKYVYSMKHTNFSIYFAFAKLIMLGVIFSFHPKENKLLKMIVLFDLPLYSLSHFIRYGYRPSYFFLPHYIYFIPRIGKQIENKDNRMFYNICVLGCLIIYWICRYYFGRYDGIIPYIVN